MGSDGEVIMTLAMLPSCVLKQPLVSRANACGRGEAATDMEDWEM